MTAPAREITLAVDGVALEAAWWGEVRREKPVFVLLHEGLGSVGLWRDFPARLAAATGLAVFAYSRPGYGRSDPVTLPRPLSYMEDEARDRLGRVLAAAGITRAILLGHSDGASIAAIYAGMAPDPRLAGLILIAPHFFVEEISLQAIAQAREAYWGGDLRARLARHHRDVAGAFRGWNEAWLDPGFAAWRIDRFLPLIRIPVLIIQGLADPYGTLAQVACAEAALPAPPRVLLVEGAGHAPHLSHQAQVLAAIDAFLRAGDPAK